MAKQANWDDVVVNITKPFKIHTGLRKTRCINNTYMTLYLISIYNNQFYINSYECESIYMNKKQLRTCMPFGHTSRSGILNKSSIGTIAPYKQNSGFCIISDLENLEKKINAIIRKKGKSLELCCREPDFSVRWEPFGCDCRRCGEQDVLKNKGNL